MPSRGEDGPAHASADPDAGLLHGREPGDDGAADGVYVARADTVRGDVGMSVGTKVAALNALGILLWSVAGSAAMASGNDLYALFCFGMAGTLGIIACLLRL